jgi:glycerophosphoryl diester phosphodiesterase/outer membrane protein assembly factor BamB
LAVGVAWVTAPSSGQTAPEIHGHRGARGLLPENTIPAFERAIELGATLELDVQVTRDRRLVVHHDARPNPKLCRRDDGSPVPDRLFRDLDYAELATIDCGSRPQKSLPGRQTVPGARIPTLQEVLQLAGAASLPVELNIEIKIKNPADTVPIDEFARLVVEAIREAGLTERSTIQSYHPPALREVEGIAPEFRTAILARSRSRYRKLLDESGATVLSPRFDDLREEDVRTFQEEGYRVVPWTVNEEGDLRRMISWGVDGIITDYPDLALSLLPRPSAKPGNRVDVLDQWPQWRGPLGSGIAPNGDPPIVWSEARNVRWKTPIRGSSHSTPVVWGNRIFLTTTRPVGELVPATGGHAHGAHDNMTPSRRLEFVVLAVDRTNGKILWTKTVRTAQPHDSTHETATWASASPVTDGEHVIAHFGSEGLYALDLDGKLLWERDLGKMRVKHGHGEGSSPALHGDTVVVNWDHEGESFVIALDKRTGEERWRITRNEGTSWSSPLIVVHEGTPQVIVAATRRVRAYDLLTGAVIWECGGLSGNVVASPVAGGGHVYVANSYETRNMLAIRLAGAAGDVTGTGSVVWTRHRDTPYVPSPVLHDDALCFLKHYQGLLTCVDPGTGATLTGPLRLPEVRNVYASLVGAAGRTYVVDREGTTVVIGASPRFEILARNRLEDSFSASPAIVGGDIFLRGARHLYCIAEDSSD